VTDRQTDKLTNTNALSGLI